MGLDMETFTSTSTSATSEFAPGCRRSLLAVKNTFIHMCDDDSDLWTVDPTVRPLRQRSDTAAEQIVRHLQLEKYGLLEQRGSGVELVTWLPASSASVKQRDLWSNENCTETPESSAEASEDGSSSNSMTNACALPFEVGFAGVDQLVDQIGGPLAGGSTVMIKNIPPKYTERKLLKEINAAGFAGRHDFFYMPTCHRARTNRGFVFLNLDTPATAEEFYHMFHDKSLRLFTETDSGLCITRAAVQGFQANAEHFALKLQRGVRATATKPIFCQVPSTFSNKDRAHFLKGARVVERCGLGNGDDYDSENEEVEAGNSRSIVPTFYSRQDRRRPAKPERNNNPTPRPNQFCGGCGNNI